MRVRKIIPAFHVVAVCLLIATLAGCDMPTKPDGVDTEGMTRIGDRLHAEGDDASAANFYQRAIEHNPNGMEAYKALAEIFESHGDYVNAGATYRQALQVKPNDTTLLRNYGRVLVEAGQPAEAK